MLAISILALLAAALRFATIDQQSFWFDEVVTARLVRLPFGRMLHAISDSEGTPPLYYIALWAWSRMAGDSESGLRSLSALAGTLTVPVVYLAGRELLSRSVGVIAAALVAASPLLVWYSQEARAYSVFAFLSSASVYFFLRASRAPASRNLTLWAGVSVLALLTHYYAIFLIVIEGTWLLYISRFHRRSTLVATAAVALACFAVLPLAVHQFASGKRAAFIADIPLENRLSETTQQFITGQRGIPNERYIGLALLILIGAASFITRGAAGRALRGAAGLAVGGLALPMMLIPLVDRFYYRNLIYAWPVLALTVAAAFVPSRYPRRALALTLAAVSLMLAVNINIAMDSRFRRDNWRSVAASVDTSRRALVVVAPGFERDSLRFYEPALLEARQPFRGLSARSIDVIGYRFFETFPPPDLRIPDGFALTRRETPGGRLEVLHFASRRPRRVEPSKLLPSGGILSTPPARAPGLGP